MRESMDASTDAEGRRPPKIHPCQPEMAASGSSRGRATGSSKSEVADMPSSSSSSPSSSLPSIAVSRCCWRSVDRLMAESRAALTSSAEGVKLQRVSIQGECGSAQTARKAVRTS